MEHLKINIIMSVCLVLGITGMVSTTKPFQQDGKQVVYVPPPKELSYLSFGFNEAIAASLWLRLLQDIEICEQGEEKAYNAGENLDEILSYKLEESRCSVGWVYSMLDRITDLSPHFLYAYSHGGMLLSVAVDDRLGAKKIFDKGLLVFPNNYTLTYSAAYHYLYEVQEPKRAAELLIRSYELGGPDWLVTLASRLYSKIGYREVSIFMLKDYINKNPDSPVVEMMKEKLKALEANE